MLDLGATTADEVDWIDVGWPSESLRSLILIDTPGIASLSTDVSARAHGFLTQRSTASAADAVIYLMRHLHASDRGFLETFRDVSVGGSLTVNAVAVLSRADEIGSARIDSLVSAGSGRAALRRRHRAALARARRRPRRRAARRDGAHAARGGVPRPRGDRGSRARRARARCWSRPTASPGSPGRRLSASRSAETCSSRFGLFGIRLSAALIRGGAVTSTALAEGLVQQSGLNTLQAFVRDALPCPSRHAQGVRRASRPRRGAPRADPARDRRPARRDRAHLRHDSLAAGTGRAVAHADRRLYASAGADRRGGADRRRRRRRRGRPRRAR